MSEEFEVEYILDVESIFENEKYMMLFRIRWKGYGPEANSWEPWGNLKKNCEYKLNEFFDKKECDELYKKDH